MKTSIVFFALFALPVFMFAQTEIPQPVKGATTTNFVNKSRGLVQVLDSSYYYEWSAGNWNTISKKCIHSRHWGTLGLPNEWYLYNYNSGTDTWTPSYYEHYTYLSDSAEMVDEQLIKPYNGNTLSWETDSLIFYDYTGYTSTMFGVMQEKIIMMNYNTTTYNFTGGIRYDVFLKNDTLYDYYEIKSYNAGTCEWENYYRAKYFYDSNNFVQRQLIQMWDDTENAYINYAQIVFAFQNGLKVQQVTQEWSGTQWVNVQKIMYTYTPANLEASIQDQEWDDPNQQWINKTLRSFTYTAGLQTEQLDQVWNTGTLVWDNTTRILKTYNTHGDMLTKKTEDWNGAIWKNTNRYTWTYNANYQMLSELYEIWDNPTSMWVGNSRHNYTYDGNDNLELHLAQLYDGGTFSWDNWGKEEYEYDIDNNNTLHTWSDWDNVSSLWVGNERYEYFYSAFDATSLTDITKPALFAYPNPSNGLITIQPENKDFETIIISDATGRIVFESPMNLIGNSVDLRTYGNGQYNITLTKSNGERISSQIVVY